MFFIKTDAKERYEVKKSVFISHLVSMSRYKNLLKTLKEEHPKATHIVWAYRHLNEFDQIVENSSDDGEPKGCAGPPTLSVMRGENLIECAILTVRYFGGTKLGVGGMIRAYTASAKEVVNDADLLTYKKRVPYKFKTPYSIVNRYEHFLKGEKIDFSDREFGSSEVLWKLSLTDEEIEKIKKFSKSL
jgi:uncharacterized YigZ family protein